jgi:hypothetical protein
LLLQILRWSFFICLLWTQDFFLFFKSKLLLKVDFNLLLNFRGEKANGIYHLRPMCEWLINYNYNLLWYIHSTKNMYSCQWIHEILVRERKKLQEM